MEKQGWIATSEFREIRVEMPENLKMEYSVEASLKKFRIASENYSKIDVLKELVNIHKDDSMLIISQYITKSLYLILGIFLLYFQ